MEDGCPKQFEGSKMPKINWKKRDDLKKLKKKGCPKQTDRSEMP